MVCCLNPDCKKPINPDFHKFCQQCGTPIVHLLRDRFKVIKPLGRGGFGNTYLAEDLDRLNEPCVVKKLTYQATEAWEQKKAIEMFASEARQLKQLGHHPQIPKLTAYFQEGQNLYLVQQYVDGHNLIELLEQNGAFSEQQIRQVLLDVLPVLQSLHDQGVIHRDLKPDNIMQRRDGKHVLIDFGVAKLLKQTAVAHAGAGTIVGSPGYASPEQIQRGRATPVGDLYGLGSSCFHLLSHVSPYHLSLEFNYLWSEDWQQYIAQSLSPDLQKILDKLLQIEPAQRYQSANEVLQDLRVAPELPSPKISLPTRSTLPGKIPQLSGKVWAAIASLGLIGVFGIGYVAIQANNTVSVSPMSQSEALLRSGYEKYRAKDYEGAIADYDESIDLDDQNADAFNERGLAKYGLQNYQAALSDYDQALTLDDRHANAYGNRGLTKHALRDYQGAVEDYNQAIRLNPQYAYVYHNRGVSKYNLKDLQGALSDYDQALRIDPKREDTLRNRGRIHYDLGKFRAALADYDQAIRLDGKHANAYNGRAHAKGKLGDWKGELADFDKALELDDQLIDSYNGRGLAQYNRKNYREAIQDYNRALRIEPDYAVAYFNRGFVKEVQNDVEGAKADFQKAADLYQSQGNQRRQDALRELRRLQNSEAKQVGN
ncbi:serine/threonine-protein kinase [Acaryochloris sp. CCMEE 5410]|uniref:serine/threonine-protein kinase n=1 Tax=Acaryochloris sp. CCMEE 5410 TaxID=310037 RepID=UPI000248491A|nr:serine/threonine-protein kinase [Acaryochloris sp. CCMEE 5410]KAI9131397.1 tetratricopeptide repeat protein [Acaryochloris sp. CCMEE 5410]